MVELDDDAGLLVAVADLLVPQLVHGGVYREVALDVVEHGLNRGAVSDRSGSVPIVASGVEGVSTLMYDHPTKPVS